MVAQERHRAQEAGGRRFRLTVALGARWREGGGAGVEDEKTQTRSRTRTQKVEDDVWMG
jgi:hypothetical protein